MVPPVRQPFPTVGNGMYCLIAWALRMPVNQGHGISNRHTNPRL